MTEHLNLGINQLRQFASQSPILSFRAEDSGSPQQDWCRHLAKNPLRRRELEEFAILGDTVVRIADGIEPAPLDKVKILSLEYAVKTLADETDAKEFVRAVKAICSSDASSFELEQIAAYYYREIRRRGTSEVLKEMGLLGLEMQAVTALVQNREIEVTETEVAPEKYTVADQRRIRRAREKQTPAPTRPGIFDEELAYTVSRFRRPKTSRSVTDEFADFYLSDEDKTVEELDHDYESFEKLEQYDENGVVGFSMADGQHAVVALEFEAEVDPSYLPAHAAGLAREINLLFVGHLIGGKAAQCARRFTLAQSILRQEMKTMRKGLPAVLPTAVPASETFSDLPFSDEEFNDWLAATLDDLYPNRVVRSVRRFITNRAGKLVEFSGTQEVNPEFDEMQYAAAVCRIVWANLKADFHFRALRRKQYQELHLAIRRTTDTGELAGLKKRAYDEFKEKNTITLKEFTALNTAARSQEIRLAGIRSPAARKTLADIRSASFNRLRYLKYFLYNDPSIQSLTRQEKQGLWEAVRLRETTLLTAASETVRTAAKPVQPSLFSHANARKQPVRVTRRTL